MNKGGLLSNKGPLLLNKGRLLFIKWHLWSGVTLIDFLLLNSFGLFL